MELNFEEMRKKEAEDNEKKTKEFRKYLSSLKDENEKETDEINKLRLKAVNQEIEKHHQEMLESLANEKALVEKTIIEKARKEYPAQWNESPEQRSLKKLTKNLFNN